MADDTPSWLKGIGEEPLDAAPYAAPGGPTLAERDLAVRTLLAEAGSQGDVGQAAVAHVLRNRLRHGGFGSSLAEIIRKPYQFEPWLHAGTGRGNDPLRFADDSPEYARAGQIFDAVMAGTLTDPTRGATHFYSPGAQAKLAMADNRKLVPDWATPGARTASIGGHEFYAPAGGAPQGALTPDPQMHPQRTPLVVAKGGSQGAVPDATPDWLQGIGMEPTGEAPAGAVPAEAPAPDWLRGVGDEPVQAAPPAPAAVGVPPAPTATPAQPWGFGSALAHGALLGFLPQVAAAEQALYDKMTGQAPEFLPRYEAWRDKFQAEREAYRKESPLAEMTGEMLGSLGTGGLAMGAAGLGARAAGLAMPSALRTGAGVTAPLPWAVEGMIQGAGQGALTHNLAPEGQGMAESIGLGGLGGGMAGAILGPIAGRVTAPLAPRLDPFEARAASAANAKFGLGLRAGQIAQDATARAFDKATIPAEMGQAQVEKFTSEVAKRIGVKGERITPDAIADAKTAWGQARDALVAKTNLKTTGKTVVALRDVIAKSRNIVDDSTRHHVEKTVSKIIQELGAHPSDKLAGAVFEKIVAKGGLIDNNLSKSTNPVLRNFGNDLRRVMMDLLEQGDPKTAGKWRALNAQYKGLLAAEPLAKASPNGIIDPSALLRRVNEKGLTGDMAELAQAGQYLPQPLHMQTPPAMSTLEKLTHSPTARAAALLGTGGALHEFGGPLIAKAGEALGFNPLLLGIPAAALMGARAGARKLVESQARSPTANALMLMGRYPNVTTPVVGAVARGAAAVPVFGYGGK